MSNPELAENKVLEVVAETTAPALSYEELLEAHPSEASQEEREAEREAAEQLQQELAAAREQVGDGWLAGGASGRLVGHWCRGLRGCLRYADCPGPPPRAVGLQSLCASACCWTACRLPAPRSDWLASRRASRKQPARCAAGLLEQLHQMCDSLAARQPRHQKYWQCAHTIPTPAIALVPFLQAAALRQQEAAVRKEQADVLKAAERAEKEVSPCLSARMPACECCLQAGRHVPVAMPSADLCPGLGASCLTSSVLVRVPPAICSWLPCKLRRRGRLWLLPLRALCCLQPSRPSVRAAC